MIFPSVSVMRPKTVVRIGYDKGFRAFGGQLASPPADCGNLPSNVMQLCHSFAQPPARGG